MRESNEAHPAIDASAAYEWDHRNRLTQVVLTSQSVEPAEGWGETYGSASDSTQTDWFFATVYAAAEGTDISVSLSATNSLTLEYWCVEVTAQAGTDFTCTATQQNPGTIEVYPWGGTLSFSTSSDAVNEFTESFALHLRIQGDPGSEIVLEADLLDADGPSIRTVTYTYDVFNRLLGRTVVDDGPWLDSHAAQTYYAYQDGQIVLQFEGDSTADLSQRYVWNPAAVDQLFAAENVASVSSPGEISWPLADHLRTIRDIAEYDAGPGTTTIANHREHDSFGNLVSETSAAADLLFGFTGRPFDAASGLQNNLHRCYDPRIGRWLSEDPIGFAAGDPNLRRYVDNAPTHFTDPSGLIVRLPGHHYVPQQLWEGLSAEAIQVFNQARIHDDYYVVHDFGSVGGISHWDYNAAVKTEFTRFLACNQINPSAMTARQAERFVKRIKHSTNVVISTFNLGIHAAARAASAKYKGGLKSEMQLSRGSK